MLVDLDQYIQWIRVRNPEARTWRDYQCDLGLFEKGIGDRDAAELLPRDIDDFINLQRERGFKPSTINRRLAAVASFYRFLIATGKARTCPVHARRHYLPGPQRLPRPVSDQDLRAYFGAVQDPRDGAMFTLMLRCGLRIGEVAGLQLADLYLGERPSRLIIHGKGARERTVFLSPETEQHLQNWLAKRPAARDKHVFLSYQHRKLSTTSIHICLQRICRSSGVRLTAHRLRHTFADHLLSAGMPITSIQKLMGHRFVETTQNYAAANDQQVQADFYKACEKLEGWKLQAELWRDSNAARDLGIILQAEGPDNGAVNQSLIAFALPARMLELPGELLRQLEAYRLLKANRWRPERVVANSILFYSQHGRMWRFFCGTCEVQNVSGLRRSHVQQFIQARLDAGRSAKTVNGSLSSLRSFLSFVQDDQIDIHPSLENIQRLKQAERLPRYLTAEQIGRLKDKMQWNVSTAATREQRQEALLLRAVFYLLWQGGLRSGEVELLRVSDLYISRSRQAKRLFIRDGKCRKGRTVYLTEVAWAALRAYLAIRGPERSGGWVFVRNGKPLKKNYLFQRFQALGRQVDVHVSPHRLRHTFATQLLNVGCQVTSIQKLLGHTNLNTTMTYARAFDQTVMTDYSKAVDTIESHPGGSWFALSQPCG